MPSRSERQLIRALRTRRGRREHGLFLVEGPRLLTEMLSSGPRITLLLYTRDVSSDPVGEPLLRAAREAGVACREVTRRELEDLADSVHPQPVVAVAEIPRRDWQDVPPGRILVLDAVQDPGNVGSLARSAEALGADAVLALPGTADPWSPKVTRAAAGATLRLPVLATGWEEASARLAARETAVWVADAAGEPIASGPGVPGRLALVLGNEGAGVSDAVRATAEHLVAAPLSRPVDSLGVAAAGAILMDRLFREAS
ncbi:MAG: TrmH family RNA methyltransferase [Gemmatimonadota bacterium]